MLTILRSILRPPIAKTYAMGQWKIIVRGTPRKGYRVLLNDGTPLHKRGTFPNPPDDAVLRHMLDHYRTTHEPIPSSHGSKNNEDPPKQ